MKATSCDVLIVGGGTGGCAAALALADQGRCVVVTEPTAWVGGQLTSQAVPPDEHPWIESFGCTARYRRYREGVRSYYRNHYPLRAAHRNNPRLNPGTGWVSRLCHEPRVGLAVLEQMLAPMRTAKGLDIRLNRVPIAADVSGDRVRSVTFRCTRTGRLESVEAKFFLDATETGDLLPLAGVEYVKGAESQSETGEPHAVSGPPEPGTVQGITWCFAMAHDPSGRDHTIERPAHYDRWSRYQPPFMPAPIISWHTLDVQKGHPVEWTLFDSPERLGLFSYRQIVAGALFDTDPPPHDVTIVNWPQNDYYAENILEEPEDVVAARLEESRELSRCLLYWLQTEAPRPDGGTGWPGLHLRPDITGTDDGLAMAPYIRESRRIRAVFTVTEKHVGSACNPGKTQADPFFDSVGVGSYRIDLHPRTGNRTTIDIGSLPFEIPMGALLPVRVRNLLPACKNLGVTHITNGCYRLHPVEWNIGESAGLLAAFSLAKGCEPHDVREKEGLLDEFQSLLRSQGVEYRWPRLHPL